MPCMAVAKYYMIIMLCYKLKMIRQTGKGNDREIRGVLNAEEI